MKKRLRMLNHESKVAGGGGCHHCTGNGVA